VKCPCNVIDVTIFMPTGFFGMWAQIIIIIIIIGETGFLFQWLSVALQRGNVVSFYSTFTTE